MPSYENRHVQIEFHEDLPDFPSLYADGPTSSPHRFADRGRTRLCVWYPSDPADLRWVSDDGLVKLFAMVQGHLFKEAWWRETGEWLGPEAPHSPPAEPVRVGPK